ncbi:MAG: histidine kinase [Marinilabiliales bacterium]|nr:histidine kinase [Marinilabiliales bacterium]
MQYKSAKISFLENLIFGVIWIGIFSIPFFNQWSQTNMDWDHLLATWLKIFGFFLIFLINVTILVPRYLIQQKYKNYLISAILVIAGFTAAGLFLNALLFPRPLAMPPMNLGSGSPMELGTDMPAPIGFKPERKTDFDSTAFTIIANVIISFLIVGTSTTFKVIGQWLISDNRRKDLEKEQLRTELAFLRHQVSPHFFMNTLNNIHSLIDINTEDAKDAVIRLSTMMRYLLYDTSQGHTSLKKEIGFLESYISLMQLRFSKHVKVMLKLPANVPEVQIPPMLFISLLENAFKHGVSYQKDSFVSFELALQENRLICSLCNSKHVKTEGQGSYSGIGLNNIRKSLELLFGHNYQFEIRETVDEYSIYLNIPISKESQTSS